MVNDTSGTTEFVEFSIEVFEESSSDIFHKVFNPLDGTAITDEILITENSPSDQIQSVTPNNQSGFTVNYETNFNEPILEGFVDKALINVTGATPSNEAAFIFAYENGDIGFGLFSSGGYSVKHSGGSMVEEGVSHETVQDVIRVYLEENYNSLLENVDRYAVIDINTFKEIAEQ